MHAHRRTAAMPALTQTSFRLGAEARQQPFDSLGCVPDWRTIRIQRTRVLHAPRGMALTAVKRPCPRISRRVLGHRVAYIYLCFCVRLAVIQITTEHGHLIIMCAWQDKYGVEPLVMVGDGATDLEARQPGGAELFIGYALTFSEIDNLLSD